MTITAVVNGQTINNFTPIEENGQVVGYSATVTAPAAERASRLQ